QNERFLATVACGWKHPFYSRRWREAGLEPGDIRSIDDLPKIPAYTSDDVSRDQDEHPPLGAFNNAAAVMGKTPLKLLTSGGTTGKPRGLLSGPVDWMLMALGAARSLYIDG